MRLPSRTPLVLILAGSFLLLPAGLPAAERLSLEARVVGIDGRSVETSSVIIWRLVPEGERQAKEADQKVARALWRDPERRAVWENLGGAATGDRLRRDGLVPGTYRVTAVLGHHSATPVGVSEAVILDGGSERTTVTVRLRAGPKLTIRPADLEGDRPLKGVTVRLEREDAAFPPSWNFSGSEHEGRITIEHLPPGTYRLHACRRASGPEELEYAAAEDGREVIVEAGVDQDLRVPMRGRPLEPAEVDQRWGWVSEGRVTDTAGDPIAGADVHVATGWGTLYGGGRTMTDAKGRFTLRFAEGIGSADRANAQAAVFFISKPGYVEASRSRPGNHLMARVMPDEGRRHGADPGRIILRGRPYHIDFVMAEPAVLDAELVGPAEAAPYVESVEELEVGLAQSSERGGPGRWNLLPGRPWRFALPFGKTRFHVRSRPFTLPAAGRYRATVRYTPDRERGVDLLEFVRFTGPDGRDILAEVVGDDPLTRPPVAEESQRKGRDILRAMAEANRDWLRGGAPPEGVRSFEYRFRLAGREGKTFKVEEGTPGPGVVRRGISHHSAVHHLVAHPENATFRLVEVGDEQIRLAYTLKEPASIWAGNGIEGTFSGFFSMPVREGTLVLDARRLTPIEHRAEEISETFSQYLEVGRGRYVPLAIRVEERGMRFDWTFHVFEPGLWLFADSRYDDGEGSEKLAAEVDQVRVNGAEGKQRARGERRPD